MRVRRSVWLVAAGVCLWTGCARSFEGLSQRPIPPDEPTSSYDATEEIEARKTVDEPVSAHNLGPQPIPARTTGGLTAVEQHDAQLAEALATLAAFPTAANHRAVADAYRRLGLLEPAHEYYSAAVQLNRFDAEAYEQLARIWRDWGFAHVGLSDAYKAVFYAPLAASAHNTLGTVLQAAGQRDAARSEYQRAFVLDPSAAYALNNLCYVSFLDGRFAEAIEQCGGALALDPTLTQARNNLALVYAARGWSGRAEAEFAAAAGAGGAAYNMGIVYLAERRYPEALDAFSRAERARPSTGALDRLRQARRLAEQNRGGRE